MRNVLQLKKANKIEVGDYILSPQHSTGILLANKVGKVEPVDGGKWIELQTGNEEKKRVFLLSPEDTVPVII